MPCVQVTQRQYLPSSLLNSHKLIASILADWQAKCSHKLRMRMCEARQAYHDLVLLRLHGYAHRCNETPELDFSLLPSRSNAPSNRLRRHATKSSH